MVAGTLIPPRFDRLLRLSADHSPDSAVFLILPVIPLPERLAVLRVEDRRYLAFGEITT